MRTAIRTALLCTVGLLVCAVVSALPSRPAMAFTVSMPDPAAHVYHVALRCEGLEGDTVEFRMPVWTPGYYGLFDYAGNVRDLRASDGQGRGLKWEKVGANAWRVTTGRAPVVSLSYDVLATNPFVAAAYLDRTRGYITPGALFVYVPGRVQMPVTVTIEPNPAWSTVATGLDPVTPDRPHTFLAPNFDVLYDSPILMGNLESLPPFEIRGVPHRFVGVDLGEFDRAQFMADLKAVIEVGIAIIGDIPYRHYTFMAIGAGQGGIEHLNSTAFGFTPIKGALDRTARNRLLAFLAHEYFHTFNVKRIRPIALGPFDYDRANPTAMLWVSEGFTVYYEYLMLARSGRMTLQELLDTMSRGVASYEGGTGRYFQSATQSSAETWSQGPFGRGKGSGLRKTISYYDKGWLLGWLLDLQIRHQTGNTRSLDTVMRALYRTYYQELGRGWTDDEFRATCERVAGIRLDEIFDYASTTRDIDYAKYAAYAGLEIEAPRLLPGAVFGALVEEVDGRLTVAVVERDSPASAAGLRAGDVIATFDGVKVDVPGLASAVAARKPGDRVRVDVIRDGASRQVEVTLGHKVERTFKLLPVARPTALQAAILKTWAGTTER